VQQASVHAMPTSDRRDIRAWLEALRQNSRSLLVTPAQAARRPGDSVRPGGNVHRLCEVLMTVMMTVILHGDIRRRHGSHMSLSGASQFGRSGRRAAYVRIRRQHGVFKSRYADYRAERDLATTYELLFDRYNQ
jgi:hypothetical protein